MAREPQSRRGGETKRRSAFISFVSLSLSVSLWQSPGLEFADGFFKIGSRRPKRQKGLLITVPGFR
jgi:hypothetical protein